MTEHGPLKLGVDACSLNAARTGVGNYVFSILAEFCASHPDVDVYLYSNTDITFPALANVTLRPNCGGYRGVLWQNFQLPGHLKRDGVDIYWGSNGLIPVIGIGRIRTMVTIHDLVHRFAPETSAPLVRWSRRLFQPLSAKRADFVMCNSQATADDVRACYGVKTDLVIHPLFSKQYRRAAPARVEAVIARYGLPDDFLLVVGTLEPRKNIANLIRAALHCRDSGVGAPLLVHAGGVGWLSDDIRALVAEAESQGLFRSLGFVPGEDLPALYSACAAFVLPSAYEGFGMPVLEAQFCGAPVMHGDHASMREAGGYLGFAFDPSLPGIIEMFTRYAAGDCGLACRLPSDIAASQAAHGGRFAAAVETIARR